MNKKAIWAIIGLMSAAVIGVVWSQMDLIRTSIKVNEEKFDKNVYEALGRVVERLKYEERKEEFSYYLNGYLTTYLQQETGDGRSIDGPKHVPLPPSPPLSPVSVRELEERFLSELNNPCMCSKCVTERDYISRSFWTLYHQGLNGRGLADRINLQQLKEIIKQELTNAGVDTEYNYGVFSKRKKSFIIVNDHYVVEDDQPSVILPGYRNLYNSPYFVHLFPEEVPSPGLLLIHFPARTSLVWSSLWRNFVGSIFFAALILFCFGYTVNVIFRQKKLSEMKTDFINNMTHEFKTPIATISLAADSITSPMISGNTEKVQRFASIIKQENKRMNSQVEKVLQMALIDKKDFSLKLTQVNLHEVINNAIENITLQVEKKEGTVQAQFEAQQPYVEGDLTHLSNIIHNLLDNANKYSPEKPEILVRTRNIPNGVEVMVKDRGIGMSKEARKHIFDKFYRVSTGNLHDVKGFGLGLSYVKAMMTAHKGTIDVKSELGKGSSFTLFFPYYVDHHPARA
jgi:two-component system phosphate regulon sensor histidine kinase PhoR